MAKNFFDCVGRYAFCRVVASFFLIHFLLRNCLTLAFSLLKKCSKGKEERATIPQKKSYPFFLHIQKAMF